MWYTEPLVTHQMDFLDILGNGSLLNAIRSSWWKDCTEEGHLEQSRRHPQCGSITSGAPMNRHRHLLRQWVLQLWHSAVIDNTAGVLSEHNDDIAILYGAVFSAHSVTVRILGSMRRRDCVKAAASPVKLTTRAPHVAQPHIPRVMLARTCSYIVHGSRSAALMVKQPLFTVCGIISIKKYVPEATCNNLQSHFHARHVETSLWETLLIHLNMMSNAFAHFSAMQFPGRRSGNGGNKT